jgi:HAD superfamily hydrolase (TIGR01549 family)
MVIFDAFGTLLEIKKGVHPYRSLLRIGMGQGRRPKPDDSRQIMCSRWGLRETADHFHIKVPEAEMAQLEQSLQDEVEGIAAYSDAVEAVDLLISKGIKVAVCSNLAQPYGQAVRRCFPAMDAYVFSYEVGALKPDPAIYSACCEALGYTPAEAVMIGDSQSCDRDGPRDFGIQGFYLDRENGQGDFAELESFAVMLAAVRLARRKST